MSDIIEQDSDILIRQQFEQQVVIEKPYREFRYNFSII